jgi:periplasmic protein TonB
VQTTSDPIFDEDEPSQISVWLKRIALALLGLLILVAIGYGIKKLTSGGDTPHKKKITTIALKDLPPPPPPPPPKEQPKEQPKDQPKEIKEVQQPKPVEAPPAEVLKMDGPAGDAPSAFAAGNPTEEYKGENLAEKPSEGKTIGSDSSAKYNWYKGVLKNQILDVLEKEKNLKEGQYKMILMVWLKSNGVIDRVEVTDSDAEPELLQTVKTALDNMPAMSEALPEGMPQPIKLRFGARKMS